MGNREIAVAMGVPIASVHTLAMKARCTLGVKGLQDAYHLAKQRIESLMPNLPLGPSNMCKVHPRQKQPGDKPVLTEALMEVFPLLAQGASLRKVSELTGLSYTAVKNRRARICDAFRVEDIFDAGQKARENGVL